jgi:DTW domain-containing protein YfiP
VWVTPTAHEADVLILQHPQEADHAKNSARLLHLSLPGSRMLTGESFDESSLHASIGDALPEPKYTVLLYPQTPDDEAPALDSAQLKDPAHVQLVVLDGTWRKSRKMLQLSPPLRRLPRLSLEDAPASNYLIRKAHKPGQLSTLEATCAAKGSSSNSIAAPDANAAVSQILRFDPVDSMKSCLPLCGSNPKPSTSGSIALTSKSGYRL